MKVSGERVITIKLPFGEALRLGIMLTSLGAPPLDTPPHMFDAEGRRSARFWGRMLMGHIDHVAEVQFARAHPEHSMD